jgi:hypothetical protein
MAKPENVMFKLLLYYHCLLEPELLLGNSLKLSEVWRFNPLMVKWWQYSEKLNFQFV